MDEYEAYWLTKEERYKQRLEFLHLLKLNLQNANKNNSQRDKNNNYIKFLANTRDRLHDSTAGTVYCPNRNKYISYRHYYPE